MDGASAGPYGVVQGVDVAGAAHEVPSAGMPVEAALRCALPDPLLLDALSALAAARTESDVAGACLPLLLDLPGVRGTAVVRRSGRDAVILGSAGYPCGMMAAGATLPLDSGLPVTECVRTGSTVVQGNGPGSWVAVPFGGGLEVPGALLLSLEVQPPDAPDLARLQRLARSIGEALKRAAVQSRDSATLAALTAGLQSIPVLGADLETAVRSVPADEGAGGDAVACLPDSAGGSWLVVADVCGSGVPAALVARSVRTAIRACAATATSPAGFLACLDAVLAPDVDPGCFVTALVLQIAPDGLSLRAASAGHPPPLLVHGGRADALELEPGPPLALEGETLPPLAELTAELPPDAAVLVHTDGLTERRTEGQVVLLDPRALAAGVSDDLEQAADQVLEAAGEVGPAQDDVTLVLARPRR